MQSQLMRLDPTTINSYISKIAQMNAVRHKSTMEKKVAPFANCKTEVAQGGVYQQDPARETKNQTTINAYNPAGNMSSATQGRSGL